MLQKAFYAHLENRSQTTTDRDQLMADTNKDQDMMSVAFLLRQRKEHKMSRKLGISTDALLRTPPPKQPVLPLREMCAKADYEMAKCQFSIVSNTSLNPLQETQISEPEEIEVKTQFKALKSFPLLHTANPIDNMFFQLPSSRIVTDEELYAEFKKEYIARGIENSLWRRRRYLKKLQQRRKSKIFK